MLEIRKDSLDWITVRVSGKLERGDYEKAVPQLEKLLAQGETRWLVEMDDFAGFSPGGLLEELKFDLRHRRDFERVAVIESSKAAGLGVRLVKPLFSGEIKVFSSSERQVAESWMREN